MYIIPLQILNYLISNRKFGLVVERCAFGASSHDVRREFYRRRQQSGDVKVRAAVLLFDRTYVALRAPRSAHYGRLPAWAGWA